MTKRDPIDYRQRAYSAEGHAFLARPPRLFIGGEWVMPSDEATIAVEDPSSGETIAQIADAGDGDVDRAVAAARAAFDQQRWHGLAPMEREAVMHRLADLIEADAELLAELEAIDNGKPRTIAAEIDIPRAVSHLRFMAGWASKSGGRTTAPYTMPAGTMFGYTVKEPVGVAAQIVPWNYPLLMACLKIAPALAAGCTVVLKPAEQTSLTTLRLGDHLAEAGFPAGVVNIVTGRGETVGERLVRHEDVDKVAFTGSTEIGKRINRAATDTLKRVTLELGGKGPVIVLPDVDPADIAPSLAKASFFNSGQVCVAGSRLFAHRSVFDRVLEGIAETAGDWAPRPSLDPEAQMGPLVSGEQLERVMGYVAAGRCDGASVVMGGDAPGSGGGGHYFSPTLLAEVSPQMSVVREEIFGPVVVAQRFDELDEVARMANDTHYGLSAGIWTHDLSAMHGLAARLKAGIVWGNCHGAIDSALPFGGFKQSGLGREGGLEGVQIYQETKTVMIKL